ncbi:hypothetical protein Tco_0496591 [Tanacetum coccineum]
MDAAQNLKVRNFGRCNNGELRKMDMGRAIEDELQQEYEKFYKRNQEPFEKISCGSHIWRPRELPRSASPVHSDNDNEVEEVYNQTVGFMASTSLNSGSGSGYRTKSLLEQWRKTKVDDDYVSYDDDLYDGYDMSENLSGYL